MEFTKKLLENVIFPTSWHRLEIMIEMYSIVSSCASISEALKKYMKLWRTSAEWSGLKNGLCLCAFSISLKKLSIVVTLMLYRELTGHFIRKCLPKTQIGRPVASSKYFKETSHSSPTRLSILSSFGSSVEFMLGNEQATAQLLNKAEGLDCSFSVNLVKNVVRNSLSSASK